MATRAYVLRVYMVSLRLEKAGFDGVADLVVSQILLRSGSNSTPKDRTRNSLVDLIERIHNAFDPCFVHLLNESAFRPTSRI